MLRPRRRSAATCRKTLGLPLDVESPAVSGSDRDDMHRPCHICASTIVPRTVTPDAADRFFGRGDWCPFGIVTGVVHLLIDTSIWLDLAKRRDGQQMIVPLRVLAFQKKLKLLVPSLVVEEFRRNRPRVEAEASTRVKERFRLLRNDLHEFGGDARHAWLEEMSHQLPLLSAMTLLNFQRGRRVQVRSSLATVKRGKGGGIRSADPWLVGDLLTSHRPIG